MGMFLSVRGILQNPRQNRQVREGLKVGIHLLQIHCLEALQKNNPKHLRADLYLVKHGHFDSRARAQAAIEAGLVQVNGVFLKKPSASIPDGADVQAEQPHPYVSRGGLKLERALEVFGIDPSGRVCLDIGSSTGGFTDVLLKAGAAKVYAVDVGRDQLHSSLRSHPKVVSMEGTDARDLVEAQFEPMPDLMVCDASFVSVRKILHIPLSLTREAAILVKPQFEVGKKNIGRGGIVKAGAEQALQDVTGWIREQGWRVIDTADSPIKGGSGNREYLLHARKPDPTA